MTVFTPRPLHVGLAVAPYEAQSTSDGVRLALALVEKVSPGAYPLTLSIHDSPNELLALHALDCGLLSAAGEPPGARIDAIKQIWTERVQALAARGAVALMLNQFRCVSRQQPDRTERLFRIRELNHAQIAVAQKNDLILIDLDCVMADLGGIYLACDHRLNSRGGHLAVVYAVADAMLKAGLRDKVDEHSLDEAHKILGGLNNLRNAIGPAPQDPRSNQHG